MPQGTNWAVALLDRAESVEEVELIVRTSARAAARADGATVVRREGTECSYVQEDAMSPLWQGRSFPMSSCISGWAMTHGQTVVVEDIRTDDRIPQDAYRPTFVRSLVIVPIGERDPYGAIGAYWRRPHQATAAEVQALQRLAAATARALTRLAPPRPTEPSSSPPRPVVV